tara:strand:- start:5428 stop:7503 length:2076 start_codon:yes stop_codon:yes gene_type:complete
MSLLITTSTQDQYGNDNLNIEKPFSFHNYLTQPLIIKPNSKIAVQSVKFNRDPTFTLSDGKLYYGYLIQGQNWDNTKPIADLSQFEWLPAPFQVAPGNYNVNQLGAAINNAVSRACQYHPDIANSTISINTDAGDNFDGFVVSFSQKTAPTDSKDIHINEPAYIVSTLGSTNRTAPIAWNNASNTLTGPLTGDSMWCAFMEAPISHQDGKLSLDVTKTFTGYIDDDANVWYTTCKFGLARPCWLADARGTAAQLRAGNNYLTGNMRETQPGSETNNYYQADTAAGSLVNSARDVWDFVIIVDQDTSTLKMYSLFNNETAGSNPSPGKVKMKEIEYWNGTGQTRPADGGATTDVLSLDKYKPVAKGGTNASGIVKVDIIVKYQGIRVEYFIDGDATAYILLDETEQKYRPPTMDQNTWALYPKFMIEKPEESVVTPVVSSIEILEYFGRSMGNDAIATSMNWYHGNSNDLLKIGSWYGSFGGFEPAYPAINGQVATPRRTIDMREGRDWGKIRAGTLAPIVTEADSSLTNFSWNWIGADDSDDKFTPYTRAYPPNINNLMGLNQGLITNTDNAIAYAAGPPSTSVLTSDTGASAVATNSLFIRINNTTQTSFNAGKSSISKIVYHIPQFNQTGQSTGALFFEPHEKTYLALNNAGTITLNDVRVDIVDKNERYAESLVGSSVVVFHIKGPDE